MGGVKPQWSNVQHCKPDCGASVFIQLLSQLSLYFVAIPNSCPSIPACQREFADAIIRETRSTVSVRIQGRIDKACLGNRRRKPAETSEDTVMAKIDLSVGAVPGTREMNVVASWGQLLWKRELGQSLYQRKEREDRKERTVNVVRQERTRYLWVGVV